MDKIATLMNTSRQMKKLSDLWFNILHWNITIFHHMRIWCSWISTTFILSHFCEHFLKKEKQRTISQIVYQIYRKRTLELKHFKAKKHFRNVFYFPCKHRKCIKCAFVFVSYFSTQSHLFQTINPWTHCLIVPLSVDFDKNEHICCMKILTYDALCCLKHWSR